MAFNPFSAFQKNQKFWMASILMLCMTTFILCGAGGEVEKRVLALFQRRGEAIAELNGHNLTQADFDELRVQRNIANDFMRKSAELSLHSMVEKLKEGEDKLRSMPENQKKGEDFQKLLTQLADVKGKRDELLERMREPRYFSLGVKLDDLMEFKVWQAQADRLGVAVPPDSVFTRFLGMEFPFLTPRDVDIAKIEARRSNPNLATEAFLRRALIEEFRVKIAQLATLSSQPADYYGRKDADAVRRSNPLLSRQVRAPMSPAMMWDYYKTQRSELGVALVPVHVRDFMDKVPAPNKGEEQRFFESHLKKYDPAAPIPGLELPQKARVGFLMADPDSPAYLGAAQALTQFQLVAPLLNPNQTPVTMAASYAGVQAGYDQELQRAYDQIDKNNRSFQPFSAGYSSADVVSPIAAWLTKREPAAAAHLVGSLALSSVSANPLIDTRGADLAAFLAWGVVKHPTEIDAGIQAEMRRRVPAYAALLAAGTATFPSYTLPATLAALEAPDRFQRFADLAPLTLPLAVVRADVENFNDRKQATLWVRASMNSAKEQLEKVAGKQAAFQRALEKVTRDYHLKLVQPPEYFTRYTIDSAASLAPLRELFLKYMEVINIGEARALSPESRLSEGDFYKLFFGSERFTAEGAYKAMPWPPVVVSNPLKIHAPQRVADGADSEKVLKEKAENFAREQDPTRPHNSLDLFAYADRPALFWKTDEKAAEMPKDPAQVQDRLVEGYRFETAREKDALPLAKAIAQDLEKAMGGDFVNALAEAKKKAGHDVIRISDLAPLHRQAGQFERLQEYGPYRLPRDLFTYPRDDMAKQLLQLYDLKEPIKIGTGDDKSAPIARQLDEINKALFKQVRDNDKKPQGKFVQILANKPMSEFYVAAVSYPPSANLANFIETIENADTHLAMEAQQLAFKEGRFGRGLADRFLMRAHEDEGRKVRQAVVSQLGEEFGLHWSEGRELEEVRKSFDRNN